MKSLKVFSLVLIATSLASGAVCAKGSSGGGMGGGSMVGGGMNGAGHAQQMQHRTQTRDQSRETAAGNQGQRNEYRYENQRQTPGGNVYRYTGRYMHSKTAWNEKGDVIIGSANLDPHSMSVNFESCLQIHNPTLAWELRRAFYADLKTSVQQTPESFLCRSLTGKALTYAAIWHPPGCKTHRKITGDMK